MSRDTFDFRRKSQRVFVDKPTGDVILRLHETDIVRVTPRGDVILSTGGWATRKTLSSMNDALELFGMWVESLTRTETQGQWQVTDSDGSVHPYINNRQNFMTTIRAKGADDRQRAEWLAEAYEIPYTPRVAPPPAAAAAPSGPRVAAAPTASTAAAAPPPAQYNGGGVAAAAATAVRPAGIGGSWANVAKTSSNPGHVPAGPTHAAAAAAPPNNARVTGPGGAAAAGRLTGPGRAAAAAAAAVHRTTGPPGFSGGSSSGSGMQQQQQQQRQQQQQQQQQPAAALVTSAPPKPAVQGGVAPPLHQQFEAMAVADLGQDDEDAHLCVVCMEEPRSIVLVPCGHMALCKSCCEQIVPEKQKCPMCCQDVEYHVEVDA